MIPWATVETLAPGVASVAAMGDASRNFANCDRVVQRLLAKSPALYDTLTTRDITGMIRLAHLRGEDMDLTIPTGAGPHKLMLRPVLGPAGDVHAVRLWLGPAVAPIPPLRPAVGLIWELDTQLIHQPVGLRRLCGVEAEEYVPRRSIAELFHRISRFDRHVEVLDLLYGPVPGQKLQFDVIVTSGSSRRGQWRISMRARDDERTRGAWWLIEDVTSDTMPSMAPTLDHVGLREAHRRAGTHLAIVQLEHATISHWLTEPAPWVRWDYLFRPVDVFHPGDRVRLADLSGRLASGDATEATVRTLNYGGGYTPTSLLLYPYPGYSVHRLTIAQLVLIGDELPIARPSEPVGYDEQLSRGRSHRMEHIPAH
ncbi:GAF domain-containing protein [Nocardia pseudovaccinii]|uniref:GAF domain-containing protein n=1 Tax=Nocardia pseudovaccinii TaxID=189540 RepID=UPI0007A44F4A|nr:GAF domain-containing protein [Nocardia pseudovaccinii]